jgi:SAM-dependent methyltransferase
MNYTLISLLKGTAKIFPKRFRAPLGMAFFRLFSLLYLGDRVACPCCGGRFRRFMARASNRTSRRVCPRCLSLERHRVLSLYLRQRTNLYTAPLKVLHFAPELCFYAAFKKLPNLRYITADIDSPLADVQMDIMDIHFEDAMFDMILCYHVLEHIPDDQRALSELYRVLKPGGWGIIQSPINLNYEKTFEDPSITSPQDRLRYYGHSDHKRWYGRDYRARLEAAGFTVKVDSYVRELDTELIERYGLRRDEDIYFVTKPGLKDS